MLFNTRKYSVDWVSVRSEVCSLTYSSESHCYAALFQMSPIIISGHVKGESKTEKTSKNEYS